MTQSLESDLKVRAESAEDVALTRQDMIDSQGSYVQAGGQLSSGHKGTSKADHAATVWLARFVKCTMRDAVVAYANEFDKFLGGVRVGLKVRPQSKGYPEHIILARFLTGPTVNLPI